MASSTRFTRRGFIASAIAAGLTAACSRPDIEPGVTEHWDLITDLIVIGSGTGLLAALVAASAGLDVVVLEKSPVVGGTTLVSGGVVWVPNNPVMAAAGIKDSRENALMYLQQLAQGQADSELLEAFLARGPEMLDFVAANTSIQWRISEVMGDVAEYHPTWKGAVSRGRSVEPDRSAVPNPDGRHLQGGGAILISKLLEAVVQQGVTIHASTPARTLLAQETASGKQVIGVIADHEGTPMRIRSRCGVLVASGGFERDENMKRHFLRGPSLYTGGAETNTGDGIRMGMALGADLRNMNSAWGMTAYRGDAEINGAARGGFSVYAQLERSHPGGICVNRYGQRFCNEAADYASSWRTFHTWENWGENGYMNIPAYQIFDQSVRRNFTIAGCVEREALPDWIVQADSLDELAAKLGIDRRGFAETLDSFNRFAAVGKDPRFHRGESPYDTDGGGPERTLKPLNEPPFFGAEVAPADIGTCGGLRVDGSARVIDVFGRPIVGLYASGNTAGVGGPGALYGAGGGTLGPAFTFAYIAAKSAIDARSETI